MCGLAGFIGNSKKPFLSNLLISKIFEKSEKRGTDAAGFWAIEKDDGKIFYYKEPVTSSQFIKNSNYQEALKSNLDLFLAHARGASKGVGEPQFNENNHPFVSEDNLIGLIHNGRIEEYDDLKESYKLSGKCDSEILLKIYENNNKGLEGIKKIFDLITEGHMAVAIGEKHYKERVLWLFRNEYRPLWLIDLSESLNQVFFVSEPSIWLESTEECRFNPFKQKIVEIPAGQVWRIDLSLIIRQYNI
jgi:glucosamine--fructose-6-phosphate aminotransferase (isomerizing)